MNISSPPKIIFSCFPNVMENLPDREIMNIVIANKKIDNAAWRGSSDASSIVLSAQMNGKITNKEETQMPKNKSLCLMKCFSICVTILSSQK